MEEWSVGLGTCSRNRPLITTDASLSYCLDIPHKNRAHYQNYRLLVTYTI